MYLNGKRRGAGFDNQEAGAFGTVSWALNARRLKAPSDAQVVNGRVMDGHYRKAKAPAIRRGLCEVSLSRKG